MITQYYIAWETHAIFTSREEAIQDYIENNYSYGYESFLEDYLCNRYSIQEIFEMTDSEKEVVRKNLEDDLWENIVNEWGIDILHVTSGTPVTAELEKL